MIIESKNRFFENYILGFSVTPLEVGGKKANASWKRFQNERATLEEVAQWDSTDFNVGIVTGKVSGIVVLDVDCDETQEYVNSLDLPTTPTVRTSRGKHYYFRNSTEGLRNRVHVNGVKLDFRGEGGYVVGPGSIHPDGSLYAWEVSPHDVPFAEIPENLLAILMDEAKPAGLTKPSKPHGQLVRVNADLRLDEPGPHRILGLELVQACDAMRKAEEGTRNNTLFKVAVRVAGHVAAINADWSFYASELRVAASRCGLERGEVEATLESAWSAGQNQPTPWVHNAAKYMFCGNTESFHEIGGDNKLTKSQFSSLYACDHVHKGKFADFLLQNGFVETAVRRTYAPDAPSGRMELRGDFVYNTYVPSAVVAESGDAARFREFIEFLVPDAIERSHVLKMIAHTVRFPGKRIRHALLLRTKAHGVGKSLLMRIWKKLVGASNVRKTSTEQMDGNFQSWAKESVILLCEELGFGSGFKLYNKLKDLLTDDSVWVNEKHSIETEWPLFWTCVMMTNQEVPLLIEEDDRRIFFVDSPALPREPGYYRDFAEWSDQNIGVIRGFIDEVDLSDFDPFAPPPMTEAKKRLISSSGSELEKDIRFLIEQADGVFAKDVVTLQEVAEALARNGSFRERAVANALKQIGGVSLGQHSIHARRRASLWAIRNVDAWIVAQKNSIVEEYKRYP